MRPAVYRSPARDRRGARDLAAALGRWRPQAGGHRPRRHAADLGRGGHARAPAPRSTPAGTPASRSSASPAAARGCSTACGSRSTAAGSPSSRRAATSSTWSATRCCAPSACPGTQATRGHRRASRTVAGELIVAVEDAAEQAEALAAAAGAARLRLALPRAGPPAARGTRCCRPGAGAQGLPALLDARAGRAAGAGAQGVVDPADAEVTHAGLGFIEVLPPGDHQGHRAGGRPRALRRRLRPTSWCSATCPTTCR